MYANLIFFLFQLSLISLS